MAYQNILVERINKVLVITFNRPNQMNAINLELIEELEQVIAEIKYDKSIVAAVLTGAGKAFMAGADLKAVSQGSVEENKKFNDKLLSTFHQIDKLPIPVIAAINGAAFGGGLEIALACTIRVASEHAKMGLPEVKLGILPGAGGTQRLPRLISRGNAMRLLLTGDTIRAEEALKMGVVDEVVSAEDLMDHCIGLATRISENAPLSVRAIKEAVNVGIDLPMEQALAYTDKTLELLGTSEDSKEGPLAFAEKRAPRFLGK